MVSDLWFDRTASEELLGQLQPDGSLHRLHTRAQSEPLLLDLQFRRARKSRISSVSLYAGLSAIVSFDERDGRYKVSSHRSYRDRCEFDEAWGDWFDGEFLDSLIEPIDEYIDRVLADDEILPRLTQREGLVHAAMCSGSPIHVIQREATASFRDQATKTQIKNELVAPVLSAIASSGRSDPWWPGVRNGGRMPSPGLAADLLATDESGRLLVIEAKPSEELKGITFAPAQVLVYARLFRRLLEEDGAIDKITQMLEDRAVFGFTEGVAEPAALVNVVPVVAIGAGSRSKHALARLAELHSVLADVWKSSGVSPLEVWLLDDQGRIQQMWRPAEEPVPDLQSSTMLSRDTGTEGSFVNEARAESVRWKLTTDALPDAAQRPAPYRGKGQARPFCLPVDYSSHNLLPTARKTALERFAAAEIPWHQGLDGGPSNHLLSSQVMCANALAPLVGDADALRAIFEPHLSITEIVPFGASTASRFDASDYVVFEWNGTADYLREGGGVAGVRGAYSTSVDAAIRYRTPDGRTEIALIEWKYVEEYQHHRLSGGERSMQTRHTRFRHFYDDPEGPVRADLVEYDSLFREPFYQLLRQQLLAWQMEMAKELDADRVRVVLVAPAANHELATSYDPGLFGQVHEWQSPEPSVYELWRQMLRRPDRFVFIDGAELIGSDAPTSDEFKSRYGHIAHREAESLERGEIRDAARATQAMFERVGGGGGVLSQMIELSDEEIARIDPVLARRLMDRLQHLAEDTRRLRAVELFDVFHSGPNR